MFRRAITSKVSSNSSKLVLRHYNNGYSKSKKSPLLSLVRMGSINSSVYNGNNVNLQTRTLWCRNNPIITIGHEPTSLSITIINLNQKRYLSNNVGKKEEANIKTEKEENTTQLQELTSIMETKLLLSDVNYSKSDLIAVWCVLTLFCLIPVIRQMKKIPK